MNKNEQTIYDQLAGRGFTILTKGWPDLLVIDEKKNTGFALEIKVDPDVVSEHQNKMHKFLNMLGIPVYVCKNGKIHNWTGRKMLSMPVLNQVRYEFDMIKMELRTKYLELFNKISEMEKNLSEMEKEIQENPETINS